MHNFVRFWRENSIFLVVCRHSVEKKYRWLIGASNPQPATNLIMGKFHVGLWLQNGDKIQVISQGPPVKCGASRFLFWSH